MEQVLSLIVTAGRVILAGIFALIPGTVVWLVVLGFFALRQRFSRRSTPIVAVQRKMA